MQRQFCWEISVRNLISFVGHGGVKDGAVLGAVNEKQEDWIHEWETMGLGMDNGNQLYMCGRWQCHDTFHEKRCIFVSMTHVIRPWDWGAKKLGILKDFEIYSVQ
jgi:hypothetical protein